MFFVSSFDYFRRWFKNNSTKAMFIISLVVLTLSFYCNFFKIFNNGWFYSQQWDSERLVVGRLVESSKNGISSQNYRLGLLQLSDKDRGEVFNYQEDVYKGIKPYYKDYYEEYIGQVGIQGILFGVINKLVGVNLDISIFWFANSFLLALIFSIFFFLVYKEFGLFSAIICFLSIFLSGWVTVIAKNLYWVVWSMFLPMVIVFYYLHLKYNKISHVIIYLLLLIALLFKFLSGFEYVSNVLMAMMVPLFYYTFRYNLEKKEFLKLFITISSIGILAFIISLLIWFFQMYIATGYDFNSALFEIERIIIKSTHNITNFELSYAYNLRMQASLMGVLLTYLGDGFWIYLVIFVLCAGYILFYKIRSLYPILITTIVAFFASISWFVLAKGHSHIHTFINFILWYVPFVPFCFILFSQVILHLFKFKFKFGSIDLRSYFNKYKKTIMVLLMIFITAIIYIGWCSYRVSQVINSKVLASNSNYSLNMRDDKLYYVVRKCDSSWKIYKFYLETHVGKSLNNSEESAKYFYLSDLKKLSSLYHSYNNICIFQLDEVSKNISDLKKIEIGTLDDSQQKLWNIEASFS